MTDSTTAKGWMRKSNFSESGSDPIQARVRADAARQYADVFMAARVKGYSQWFEGKRNNVADALSREWHRSNDELTFLLHSLFPSQMPVHFVISPLPKEISSWLISLLQQLPVSEQLRERHTTARLERGDDGQNIAGQSDATICTWTNSPATNESPCSALLPWLSAREDSCGIAMKHWPKAQSEVPFHMWFRPSGRRADRPVKKRTTSSSFIATYTVAQDKQLPQSATTPRREGKKIIRPTTAL